MDRVLGGVTSGVFPVLRGDLAPNPRVARNFNVSVRFVEVVRVNAGAGDNFKDRVGVNYKDKCDARE